MEAYLRDLLARMDAPPEAGEQSWNAYREAEALTDTAALPILREMILTEQEIREDAYFVYGKILENSQEKERADCQFLIDRLTEEEDSDVRSAILDLLEYMGTMPAGLDISPIIALTKDSDICQDALTALRSFPGSESRKAIFCCLEQSEDDPQAIPAAQYALGFIGSGADIPVLARRLHSRFPDIRVTAKCAIENIQARLA